MAASAPDDCTVPSGHGGALSKHGHGPGLSFTLSCASVLSLLPASCASVLLVSSASLLPPHHGRPTPLSQTKGFSVQNAQSPFGSSHVLLVEHAPTFGGLPSDAQLQPALLCAHSLHVVISLQEVPRRCLCRRADVVLGRGGISTPTTPLVAGPPTSVSNPLAAKSL